MSTMQTAVDLARVDLNDADKVRWPDADLLKHANAAIRLAYQLRPDLRFGNYATAFTDLALNGTFPICDNYLRAVADFIIGRASAVDAEHVDSGRVPMYVQSFRTLLGVG